MSAGRRRVGPPSRAGAVLRHLQPLGGKRDRGPADRELLGQFADTRDEAAFAAIVARHGRLVWGVCRRVLASEHDAEDAFQATFLVLARDPGAVRDPGALASWLYGVAYRIAMKARRTAAKHQSHEARAPARAGAEPPPAEAALRELQAALDRGVQELPEKYRTPFVLCCLEGRTKAEAAAELGWTEGTVSSRIARARAQLREALDRRGFSLSAVLSAGAVTEGAAWASQPARLGPATVEAGLAFAAGGIPGGGPASGQAVALAKGMVRTMALAKLKTASHALGFVLAAGLGAAAGGVMRDGVPAAPPAGGPPGAAPAGGRPGPKAVAERAVRAADEIADESYRAHVLSQVAKAQAGAGDRAGLAGPRCGF